VNGAADILIVDDDREVSAVLAEVLGAAGYCVRVAHDGDAGFRMLGERKLPDAMIVDVEMPQLTGPEMVYQMIIADAGKEHIPIILVSAIVGLAEVAKNVGTPYFLGKPFDIDTLLALLDVVLKKS
jgi:DNA-binding response OmpR family regulator